MPRSTARPRRTRPTTGAALAALAVAGLALGTGGVARADVPEPVDDSLSVISTVPDLAPDQGAPPNADPASPDPAATDPAAPDAGALAADDVAPLLGDFPTAPEHTAPHHTFTPSPTPTLTPTPTPSTPTGHVRTGVGGSISALDTPQIAAGVAVLAASAVGGTWLLRRRASGSR
jgi:hypothetical protein